MPKNSIEGSAFPTLEQEGRSVSHADRTSHRGKVEKQNMKKGKIKEKEGKREDERDRLKQFAPISQERSK